MINVKEEQSYSELMLGAQLLFKQKFGRFPDSKEFNELDKLVESMVKEQRKNAEQTKTDWVQRR